MYTLWSADTLLGEADLAPVPDAPGTLSGPFRPAPAFAGVWPTLRTLQTLNATLWRPGGVMPALMELGTNLTPDTARRAIAEIPGTADELGEVTRAQHAVDALALVIRDGAGRPVDGVAVGVLHAAEFPALPGFSPELLAEMAADPDLADQYTLVATPRRRYAVG